MARRVAVVLLLGLASCFTEPEVTPGGSGATEGTTSAPCVPGEVLCECRPDGSCDMDLACVPAGCIPDDCDPGTPMCTCLQPGDVCAEGWACTGGLCHEVMSTSTTTSPDSMGNGPEPLTSGMPTSDESMSTSAAATSGMTADDAGSQGSSGMVDCGMTRVNCSECAFCSLDHECKNEYDVCAEDQMGCLDPLMCLNQCLQGLPEDLATCIGYCDCAASGDVLRDLVDCTEDACAGLCADDLPCSTMG